MRLSAWLVAASLALTSLTAPSYASLKHTDSDVFIKLADLTRKPHERKGDHISLESLRNATSASSRYKEQGVDWRVSFDGSADRKLVTGQHNDNGLNMLPTGMGAFSVRKAAYHAMQEIRRLVEQAPSLLNEVTGQHGSTTGNDMHSPQRRAAQNSSSTFSPLKPPSIPLAVKSPYVNVWAPAGQLTSATPPNAAGNGGGLAGQFPAFWTTGYGADGDFRLGWGGFIRVDNTTYQWMGDNFGTIVRAGQNARQLSFEYTATRSTFKFEAAGVHFTVTFVSPIWPNDYLRQSIPLSYMHFELDRASANGHSVQMFTDIDERWSSAHDYDYENYPMNMLWSDSIKANKKESSAYFIQRTNPQRYKEFRQRAEWGSAVYAMRKRAGMSSRNNNNIVTQLEFLTRGTVTYDHNPVGGPDNSFSFTVDFDEGNGGDDALFSVGHLRSPYVNYIRPASLSTGNGSRLEDRYGYWMTKYPQFQDAVAFFMGDFENALQHCKKLDAQIDADSRAVVGGGDIGNMYSAITQLSVRQSFATLEITVPYDTNAKAYDTNDTIIFLKEISSNGDMQTVDVFTPQFPLLTYLNPDLLRDVMKPIFEYTESGLYPNKWCVHDLGVYPSAFGHNDGKDEPMQVEESGNMILLALHYAQLVGKDKAVPYLQSHYKIMQQWAQFLVEDSLIPALQLSTDDFAGTLANQTNLALKGIQGIAAMGQIADMVGKSEDATTYRNTSQTYIEAYYGYALTKNGSHVKLAYQLDDSWGTLYNLVFDKLLNLRLVTKDLYTKQDAFYPTKANTYGLPLDSRKTWAKTDWQIWASATAADPQTRDFFIRNVHKYVSDAETDAPFSDLYETRNGDFPKEPWTPLIYFIARPVVGGHFMHLALDKANKANQVGSYQYGPPIGKGKDATTAQASAVETVSSSLQDDTLKTGNKTSKAHDPSAKVASSIAEASKDPENAKPMRKKIRKESMDSAPDDGGKRNDKPPEDIEETAQIVGADENNIRSKSKRKEGLSGFALHQRRRNGFESEILPRRRSFGRRSGST